MSKSGQALTQVLREKEAGDKRRADAKKATKKREDEQKSEIASEQQRLREEFYARRES